MQSILALSNYVFIDLEVEQEKIYHLGLVSEKQEQSYRDVESAQELLEFLREQGLHICGHNFRRFDYEYLIARFPKLDPWLIVDTLELSILAFPLERSHKLNKDYKLSEYGGNNPLEDAVATKSLLENIINILNAKPKIIINIYAYLLSCGNDPASQAYRHFFTDENCLPPSINELPAEAIANLDTQYLSEFLTDASIKSFEQRLCVAGILAWQYETNVTNSKLPLSSWLIRLPDCIPLFNQLKPVIFPNEFTYQPYLEEFGISEFRSVQEPAIQAILSHQSPLILMATGGGKSLCYQLPALMLSRKRRGLSLVISPLQALMADQVNGLEEKGLDFSTFINGTLAASERKERLEQIRNGEKDLLYISPEQLRSPSIRALLQERLPILIVFDEAHCISQWGHDFRPDYRYAPKFLSEIYQNQELPMLAFMTATATLKVREDIKKLFEQYQIIIRSEICSSSHRSNLNYQIIPTSKQAKDQILIEQVKSAIAQYPDGAILVYTSTRKKAEDIANLLNQNQIEAAFYHGTVNKDRKQEILKNFKSKELNVIVATCAFGMGIDRSDVRAVIHHSISGNLEGYVQEAGRAGRDNNPADCTLLYDSQDADTAFFLQSLNQLSEKELRNLFVSIRTIRDHVFNKKASEEFFWVTTNEIFQTSDLDQEFATQEDQRDTKIKVALHYLETFGMVEREENQSSFIEFDLIYPSPQDSLKAFDLYAHSHNLPKYRIEEFHHLILAMHLAKAYCENNQEPFSLEKLSDLSGLAIKGIKQYIKELEKAKICTTKIPATLLISKTKTERGGAIFKFNKHKKLEEIVLQGIIDTLGDRSETLINCRALATRLDPNRKLKLSSQQILEILEGWQAWDWIAYQLVRGNVIKLTRFTVTEYLENYHNFFEVIIKLLYETLEDVTGDRLRVKQDLGELLTKINQKMQPQVWELPELERSLTWMHRHNLIRIAEGLNLFYQSMKVKVTKGVKEDKVITEFPKQVKPHYDEQTRRTHIMLDYGEQHKKLDFAPQNYIESYFSQPHLEFSNPHPNTHEDLAKLPVTQEDYDRIINPLNPIQREIVLCESPAISVIAGPGSGKTRTIVHRIAYLVKVKRIDPARIIALVQRG
jgi:ATP-dependent DNA helicase RecQ